MASTQSDQSERIEQGKAFYAVGRRAFERGNYKEAISAFEAGIRLVGGATALGGDIQLWLMNAYSATNCQSEVVALGEKLARHPDREIRKQSKRVAEILNAPKLKRRADWLTPIPDLSDLDSNRGGSRLEQYARTDRTLQKPKSVAPQPEDLSQINTEDNGFLWLSILVVLCSVVSLWLLR